VVGVFLFSLGIQKVSWLLDSHPLAGQLSRWLETARPASSWYLERLIPGTPVFARLVPLGEICSGLALFFGFWTRLAAGLALVMVLNYHVASGSMFRYTYLSDGYGLLAVGALLGLTLGGGRLPLSLSK